VTVAIYYQTAIIVGGGQYHILEPYDSIVERMSSSLITREDREARLPSPVEVTLRGPEDRPVRAAINPAAISMVCEVPPADQIEVVE
jgi:hypothetical protein